MSSLREKVRRLEKKYEKANRKLRQFEDENIKLMEQLQELSMIRNAALQELEAVVRKSRVEAAGMQVSVTKKKTYDGEALYNHFKSAPVVRDKLVQVKYSVVGREFESMVAQGIIPNALAEDTVLDEKEVVTVRRKPLPYQLG